jgi:hypothetical protein
MFAAAGIVVTEISTPISAPDLAVERLSMPAAPAQQATKAAKKSGLAMTFASAWSAPLNASGVMPEREVASSLHGGDAEAGDRPELRADDHRADDQDRRVQKDADGRDQGRQHHEDEEDAGELDALVRAVLDLLPYDGVSGGAGRVLLGLLGVPGERRVHELEGDRSVLVDLQALEVLQDHARVLARDVAQDHVAVRAPRRVAHHDHVDHRRRAVEHLQDGFRAVGRRDDPQMDHGRQTTRARLQDRLQDPGPEFRATAPNQCRSSHGSPHGARSVRGPT